jgi:hypothetical protein
MRRSGSWLLLSVLTTSGLSACSNDPAPAAVTDQDPLTAANGLTSNGLTSNGLTSNGLTSNGLTSNGLTSNGLTSNGLVMQALEDPSATGDLTRIFFSYLISCALPAGHSVTFSWTDSTGTVHTQVNPGGLGLAPDWENGAATEDDKEIVSACLGARTNSKGLHVPISMRAKDVAALAVSSVERDAYTYGEGSFWGNLFDGDHPYLYSCSRAPLSAGTATSQYLSQGRTCTTTACGIITPVGPCYSSDLAVLGGQACFARASNDDWSNSCNPQKSPLVAGSTHVISTWLQP